LARKKKVGARYRYSSKPCWKLKACEMFALSAKPTVR